MLVFNSTSIHIGLFLEISDRTVCMMKSCTQPPHYLESFILCVTLLVNVWWANSIVRGHQDTIKTNNTFINLLLRSLLLDQAVLGFYLFYFFWKRKIETHNKHCQLCYWTDCKYSVMHLLVLTSQVKNITTWVLLSWLLLCMMWPRYFHWIKMFWKELLWQKLVYFFVWCLFLCCFFWHAAWNLGQFFNTHWVCTYFF